ncbi:MAG: hypothetical protein JNL19_11720 [Burkholderiales bacterium]|nr:hypothetical protein [Burkholderiales bacterium]
MRTNAVLARALRVLLVVFVGLTAASLPWRSVQAQPIGASDDSGFGFAYGFATFSGADTADVRGSIASLVALPDGGVLAGGSCKFPPDYTVYWACLYRWRASDYNNLPDPTFGINGVSYVMANATGAKIVRRKDGRIWVVALCAQETGGDWCTAMVNANGIGFDTSYGSGGVSVVPRPSGYGVMRIRDIALQPDGKLLIAGTCAISAGPASNASFCATRLTANGAFDSTFGVGNWLTTIPGPGDDAHKLTLLSDGGFYLTGGCGLSPSVICNLRYTANGAYVSSVASNWGSNLSERVHDVRERAGKVTIAGVDSDSGLMHASRYTWASAASDPTFGGIYPATGMAGNVSIDFSHPGHATAAKILRDGSIFFHGDCNNGAALCTARFTANGLLDATYGVSGRYETAQATPFAPAFIFPAELSVIEETADGHVLVGGSCWDGTTRPCVRRYLGGPNTAKVCTMDIDGDGVVNPTTDGLLLARISLGLKGSAALAGAIAPGATRTTWTQVRDYLFNECNMPVAP